MRKVGLTFGVLGTIALVGCGETSFKSGNNKKSADLVKPKDPVHNTLKLKCDDANGSAKLTTAFAGDNRSQVKIEGEFCGVEESTSEGKLTVLFVVDRSGSMEENDPLTDGSCGRLKAAEALVKKLEGSMKPGIGIDVGMQPFGDLATTAVSVQSLAAFKASLTTALFCDNGDGATNYDDAFRAAKTTLESVEGPKAVYFVSDGLPTRAGSDPFGGFSLPTLGQSTEDILKDVQDKGVKAAEALRALPGVTLNAIYLSGSAASGPTVPTTTVVPGLSGIDPQIYLEQIAGAKERVRLATDADALAAQIVTLETPEVFGLEKESANGSVASATFGQKTLKLATLEKHPSRDGVWTFTTEPFPLFGGNTGSTTDNDITVTVKASDGKTYTATAKVAFKVQ